MNTASANHALSTALVQSAQIAIVSISLEGEIELWNPAAARLFGLAPDKAIGAPIDRLISATERAAWQANLELARQGNTPSPFDLRMRTARDEPIDATITLSPVLSDSHEIGALSLLIQDSSGQRRIERDLQELVDDRTRELRVLLDIAHDVAATLELGPLVGLILDRVKGVVDYVGAALFVLDDDGDGLNLLRYQGPIPQHTLAWRWTLTSHDHAREVITTRKPVIIDDVFGDSELALAFRRNAAKDIGEVRSDFGAWMGVPLTLGDRVTGMLAVEIPQVGYYTPHHAELLGAVADQAAVAIENARLYEQARGLAALEERQKLARELHDSVSQALFGIGLGARTARAQLDRDPAKVSEPLDYVITLAETGLTEMRALIFELRPDALETEGLKGLLEKQAAVLRIRHGLHVETMIEDEPETTLAVKESLYRIAQESLHNITKHAQATRVSISVQTKPEGIVLDIADDGIGFDPSGSFPGHLGLRSMRERAARQGATVDLASSPGNGTRIRVLVPPAR